ncbi:MAG: hypothetical protein Q7V88_08595 [Actinomycetota bacterium]|nr:hypothetical protein [Actinomycetota bacterium]
MWPHTFTIAVDDTLIAVGTDDDELMEVLEPWVTDGDTDNDTDNGSNNGSNNGSLTTSTDTRFGPSTPAPQIDFGLELHPARPEARGARRELPTFRHGTRVVGRAADIAALRDGLLRTLGSLTSPTLPGCIRISGVPLLRDGGVELAQPEAVDRVSHRWLLHRGLTPLYVPSVLIDPHDLTVRIEAPLGAGEAPVMAPLRRWWAALPAAELPRGQLSVGQMAAHTAHRLAPALLHDEATHLAGPSRDALAGLVALIQQLPPAAGGPGS